ncbi:SusC/RagA family TonB-linked outer membrane protein [Roseisolibacter agri]|uniref:SusC/RagA family TonB-linked outer membrane protein n=1 Tax=Roseisolibacter agri TaxID=2014610 RepID=A0AA37V2U7_9BACT|nr:SusC/RagA family TonB-linked outer membrane protein [Roseisolibacter agri]GLC25722.1 SusC/RagA family TonB-linked outer membrane protein [Roseisolibacter agri]
MIRTQHALLAAVAVAAVAPQLGAQQAAQRRVTGVVTVAGSGEPLGAVTVQVVGTTTGTLTGDDGRFALQAPNGTSTLRVRRIGYQARTVVLAPGQSEISVALERDVLQLETAVVTGTATSVSRLNAANAVATVSAEQLVGRAPAQSVDNALQGKVAGAIISTNSGAPGGGSQVQLRGVSSINAASTPLYVVDGVLVSNQAFGNGLNSLTTAGTGQGPATISTSQDQTANRIADLNPEDIESVEILKGPSAGAIYGSKAANGVVVIRTKRGSAGRPAFSLAQRVGTYQLQQERKLDLRCFGSVEEAMAWEGVETAAELAAPFTGQCHDFQDAFYKADGPSYQTSLALRGGTAGGTTYHVSGLLQRDNAIQKGTYYGKQSLSANVGQAVGSRLTLQSNNAFMHTLTDRGISGNDNAPVVSPISVFSGTPQYFNAMARDSATGQYPRNPYLPGGFGGTNPFQTAELTKLPQDVFRYVGSVNATYNAFASTRQSLDFTVLGGVDAFSQNNKVYSPPTVYFEPADGFPGTIVNTDVTSQYANLNASGVHRLTLAPLSATTSFGVRREYRNSDVVFNRGRNVPLGAQSITLAADQLSNEDRFRVHDFGWYVQEELLALDERLAITGALNAERSSTNGDAGKYYTFPKASASYRLPFLPPATEELKLRAAYGRAGNQVPFGYAYTALITGVYGGTLGARPSATAGSRAIRPETSTELEGGVDLTMLKGRLALSGTVFRTDVDDLILLSAPATSSGYAIRIINGGAMYKTGTELELSATPVQTRDVTWTSRTTFSNFNSRITRLDVPPFSASSSFSPRYGEAWVEQGRSITTARVVTSRGTSAGTVYGFRESAPDFQMGFSNDLTFGRVRLAGLLDWRKGGGVANLTNNYFDSTNLFADTAASQQRLRDYVAGRPVYFEKATFLKLRELNLSYQLPDRFVRSAFGSQTRDVRLELSGRNLYTWAPYTGYDPEVSNFGNQNLGRFQDVTPYPPSRSFFLAVTANF